MAIRFNPLTFSSLQFVDSGGSLIRDPVPTEADLPVPAGIDGEVRVVLATDHIYVYDNATSKWIDQNIAAASVGVTANTNGYSLVAATTGNVTAQTLVLQPANASNPGVVTTTAQTLSGIKTLNNAVYADGGVDVTSTGGTDTLSLGVSNADVINIGNPTATINMVGSVNNNQVTNLNVTDPLITINKGGGVGSAAGTGLEFEENSTITGYVKTSATRNALEIKAPSVAGIVSVKPQATDADVVLTEGNQTLNGDKTISGTTNLSALTASKPLKLDASKNVVASNIALTTDVTGVLSVANGGTNSSTALNNNRVVQSSGGALVEAAAITASRALVSDTNGIPTQSVTTTTELGYLSGTTSSVQTQIGSKVAKAGDTMTGSLNMNGLTNLNSTGYIDTSVITAPSAPGSSVVRTYTLDGNGLSNLFIKDSSGVEIGLGKDLLVIVRNTSGSTLTKGSAVTVNGATGTTPHVITAIASFAAGNLPAEGILAETIANNAFGRMIQYGTLTSIDTSAYAAGDHLYVSPTVSGGLVNVRPVHPNYVQRVATVLVSGVGNGALQIEMAPNMLGAETGTNRNTYAVGDATAGTKTIQFKNTNTGSLQWTPTGSRTLTLPDVTDTLVGKATSDVLTNKSVDATTNTLTNISNTSIAAAAAIAVNKLAAVTASRALASDVSGFITPATTTSTELNFVSGVTSAIQTQLDSKGGITPGQIAQTTFSGLVNNTANQNITGLAFANGTVRFFEADMTILVTATANTYTAIKVSGIQKASTWEYTSVVIGDTITGLSIGVTNAGQVQISVGNITGFTSATIKFKASTIGV
jgi:predicted flap endonuclease-1-like 5' DNA nuclease